MMATEADVKLVQGLPSGTFVSPDFRHLGLSAEAFEASIEPRVEDRATWWFILPAEV